MSDFWSIFFPLNTSGAVQYGVPTCLMLPPPERDSVLISATTEDNPKSATTASSLRLTKILTCGQVRYEHLLEDPRHTAFRSRCTIFRSCRYLIPLDMSAAFDTYNPQIQIALLAVKWNSPAWYASGSESEFQGPGFSGILGRCPAYSIPWPRAAITSCEQSQTVSSSDTYRCWVDADTKKA